MKTLQELSDRLEIQDLLVDYCYAVDLHRWDELDAIFTPDAELDFSATGGARGNLAEIKVFFDKALNLFAGHQHLVATSKIAIDGDTATGRTICHNPMWFSAEGEEQVLYVGLWYRDRFVRTTDGWRISSRVQEKGYLHGLPGR